AGLTWGAHLLTSSRVDPVHPRLILLRRQRQFSSDLACAVYDGVGGDGVIRSEVVLIGPGAVGFDVASGGSTVAAVQADPALHAAHRLPQTRPCEGEVRTAYHR